MKLRRSRTDVQFTGLCAGIAKTFSFKVNVVRIGFMCATIATGFFFGIAAYFLISLIVPVEDEYVDEDESKKYYSKSEDDTKRDFSWKKSNEDKEREWDKKYYQEKEDENL